MAPVSVWVASATWPACPCQAPRSIECLVGAGKSESGPGSARQDVNSVPHRHHTQAVPGVGGPPAGTSCPSGVVGLGLGEGLLGLSARRDYQTVFVPAAASPPRAVGIPASRSHFPEAGSNASRRSVFGGRPPTETAVCRRWRPRGAHAAWASRRPPTTSDQRDRRPACCRPDRPGRHRRLYRSSRRRRRPPAARAWGMTGSSTHRPPGGRRSGRSEAQPGLAGVAAEDVYIVAQRGRHRVVDGQRQVGSSGV